MRSRGLTKIIIAEFFIRVSHVAKSVTIGSHPESEDDLNLAYIVHAFYSNSILHEKSTTYKHLLTVLLKPYKEYELISSCS